MYRNGSPRAHILTSPVMACLVIGVLHAPVASPNPVGEYRAFHDPERVTIRGYDGHAMEPFLTRDGRYLLFNNLNDPSVNTNLHWAVRVDDLTFQYRGEIEGVNTAALEGVPTMDRAGTLYFVSTRSYGQTLATIYRGKFADGKVTGVEIVPGVSPRKLGIVNFDAETTPDGKTLYTVDGLFQGGSTPKSSKLVICRKRGAGFERLPNSDELLANVNTGTLQYAACISKDERELFFTRLDNTGTTPTFATYLAARRKRTDPFGVPEHVTAITGFAEAPTISPDERSLYFHRFVDGRMGIWRVRR